MYIGIQWKIWIPSLCFRPLIFLFLWWDDWALCENFRSLQCRKERKKKTKCEEFWKVKPYRWEIINNYMKIFLTTKNYVKPYSILPFCHQLRLYLAARHNPHHTLDTDSFPNGRRLVVLLQKSNAVVSRTRSELANQFFFYFKVVHVHSIISRLYGAVA